MQEMGRMMFGDDEEKEAGFYGADWGYFNFATPIKIVLPPSTRVPESLFELMMTKDWQRFTGFSIHSWYPFGRLTRDTFKATQDMNTMPERLFGIPASQAERAKDEIEPFDLRGDRTGPFEASEMLLDGGTPASPAELEQQMLQEQRLGADIE